jgi:hypothetical protein
MLSKGACLHMDCFHMYVWKIVLSLICRKADWQKHDFPHMHVGPRTCLHQLSAVDRFCPAVLWVVNVLLFQPKLMAHPRLTILMLDGKAAVRVWEVEVIVDGWYARHCTAL